jgi:hypothetical protein
LNQLEKVSNFLKEIRKDTEKNQKIDTKEFDFPIQPPKTSPRYRKQDDSTGSSYGRLW